MICGRKSHINSIATRLDLIDGFGFGIGVGVGIGIGIGVGVGVS